MLNDDDIRKRLELYPEPPEVVEIRRNIQESFKRLEFQEGPHKYYVHEDDGTVEELPSVSATIEKWEQYVDWDAKKEKKALELGMTVEEVSRMWREKNIISTSNGTLIHALGEAYMYFFQGKPDMMPDVIKKMQYEDGWLIPYGPKQFAAMQYYIDMYDMFMDDSKPNKLWPVMPESQVYIFKDNEFGITKRYAGTFDILHAYKAKDGKWKLAIHDWKSNASLTKDFARVKKIYMEPPFDDLIDEPLSHYFCQLSAYSCALQQLGYEVGDRRIIWLKDDGTYEKIPAPDFSDRVKMALK